MIFILILLQEEQGEGIESIQTLVEESVAHTNKAVDELTKANQAAKDKRKNVAIGVGAGAGVGAAIIAILTLRFLH